MGENAAMTGGLAADTSAARRATDPRGRLRSAVIVNPVRVDDVPVRRRAVETELAAAGWPAPIWLESTTADPGTGQARRAAGTGNLPATNFGVPNDTAAAVRLAIQGDRTRIDVGDANGQAFAVMAGMGFDAALLRDASRRLKAVIGAPAYVLCAVRHLRDRRMRVQITLDDDPPLLRQARSVVIGNVGRLQGGVHLLTEAEPDNGHLEVAILAPHRLHHWFALAWAVLHGHRDVAHMEVLRASRITVASDRDQPRQLDGDVIDPGCSLTITVRPGALELCVPRPER